MALAEQREAPAEQQEAPSREQEVREACQGQPVRLRAEQQG